MLAEASRLRQIFFNPKKKKKLPIRLHTCWRKLVACAKKIARVASHSYHPKKKKIVRGDSPLI